MVWHTGSHMHAIHDPAASIDITKLGRKYGNLKADVNSKGLSYDQDNIETDITDMV